MLGLLARSASGQALSVYTNIITGPRRPADVDGPDEVHVVVLDNGRSRILGSRVPGGPALHPLRRLLNACPVYRQVGGHAYGSVYAGPDRRGPHAAAAPGGSRGGGDWPRRRRCAGRAGRSARSATRCTTSCCSCTRRPRRRHRRGRVRAWGSPGGRGSESTPGPRSSTASPTRIGRLGRRLARGRTDARLGRRVGRRGTSVNGREEVFLRRCRTAAAEPPAHRPSSRSRASFPPGGRGVASAPPDDDRWVPVLRGPRWSPPLPPYDAERVGAAVAEVVAGRGPVLVNEHVRHRLGSGDVGGDGKVLVWPACGLGEAARGQRGGRSDCRHRVHRQRRGRQRPQQPLVSLYPPRRRLRAVRGRHGAAAATSCAADRRWPRPPTIPWCSSPAVTGSGDIEMRLRSGAPTGRGGPVLDRRMSPLFADPFHPDLQLPRSERSAESTPTPRARSRPWPRNTSDGDDGVPWLAAHPGRRRRASSQAGLPAGNHLPSSRLAPVPGPDRPTPTSTEASETTEALAQPPTRSEPHWRTVSIHYQDSPQSPATSCPPPATPPEPDPLLSSPRAQLSTSVSTMLVCQQLATMTTSSTTLLRQPGRVQC